MVEDEELRQCQEEEKEDRPQLVSLMIPPPTDQDDLGPRIGSSRLTTPPKRTRDLSNEWDAPSLPVKKRLVNPEPGTSKASSVSISSSISRLSEGCSKAATAVADSISRSCEAVLSKPKRIALKKKAGSKEGILTEEELDQHLKELETISQSLCNALEKGQARLKFLRRIQQLSSSSTPEFEEQLDSVLQPGISRQKYFGTLDLPAQESLERLQRRLQELTGKLRIILGGADTLVRMM